MEFKGKSNEELVEIAGGGAGVKSIGAQAELTKRLIDTNEKLNKSIVKSDKNTDKQNKVLNFFTMVLIVTAVFQLVVSILVVYPNWYGLIIELIILFSVLACAGKIAKETLPTKKKKD